MNELFWERWKKFSKDQYHYDALLLLKEELDKSDLNFTYEINDKRLILKSGELSLTVYHRDIYFTLTPEFPVELTFLPEKLLLNSCRTSTKINVWITQVITMLKTYGKDFIPWNKRTEQELLSLMFENQTGLRETYQIDATQELARRCRTKKVFIDKTKDKETFFKCSITNLWLCSYQGTYLRYYTDTFDTYRTTTVCSWAPREFILEKFVCYQNLLIKRNQEFVNPITGELRNGEEAGVEFCVPLWYFKSNFIKAGCGHYELLSEVISGLCTNCVKTISPTGKIINPYSCRAPEYLKFQKGDEKVGKYSGNTVYYGLELELENGKEPEAIKLYKDLKDYLLCKSDGSVSGGFEIITTPATYDVHRKKTEILLTIINNQTKMKALTNCGLHIHVSKNAVTTMQIGKLSEFLYNPTNRDFITNIAGRNNSSYAKIDLQRSITDLAPENFTIDSQERFVALNLRNEHTIEFRLFASTTDYYTLMSRLDFVKALINYTRPCAVNIKSLKEIKEKDIFLQFLENNKKDYSFLTEFLGMKKAIPQFDPSQRVTKTRKGE